MKVRKLENFVSTSNSPNGHSQFLIENEHEEKEKLRTHVACHCNDLPEHSSSCDACEYCDDCCEDEFCRTCRADDNLLDGQNYTAKYSQTCSGFDNRRGPYRRFTHCQIRRHNHEGSAWLIVDGNVYDATSVLLWHPGGKRSILRDAGGAKNSVDDLKFHSKTAIKLWKSLKIGELRQCIGSSMPFPPHTEEQCVIS